MRKILLLMALVVCTATQAGKVVTDSIKSNILGTWVKYNVYLPNGFDSETQAHYPVVYLLHGFTDDYTAWRDKGPAAGREEIQGWWLQGSAGRHGSVDGWRRQYCIWSASY